MSSFLIYLDLGYDHIMHVNGIDHILFVIAICATYTVYEWKKILVLITAFTIGHSVTLALSVLNTISIDSTLVELLIPITIFITAVSNIVGGQNQSSKYKSRAIYFVTFIFGLVHGMGFSNYLKVLLGKSSNIIGQLFGFNIGLELGQVVIVLSFLLISLIFAQFLRVKKRDFQIVISAAVAGASILLIIQNLYLNN